jgi:hypothetical protein
VVNPSALENFHKPAGLCFVSTGLDSGLFVGKPRHFVISDSGFDGKPLTLSTRRPAFYFGAALERLLNDVAGKIIEWQVAEQRI